MGPVSESALSIEDACVCQESAFISPCTAVHASQQGAFDKRQWKRGRRTRLAEDCSIQNVPQSAIGGAPHLHMDTPGVSNTVTEGSWICKTEDNKRTLDSHPVRFAESLDTSLFLSSPSRHCSLSGRYFAPSSARTKLLILIDLSNRFLVVADIGTHATCHGTCT